MAISPLEQTVAPIAKRSLRKRRITLDEFLNRPNEEFSEWVDGKVIQMSVTPPHQLLSDFLSALIQFLAEEHDLGVVLTAPCALKLSSRPSGREPDIMFIAKENAHRILATYVDGPADIVVEIANEDSRTRDRRDKFFEYAQGGVREYWLLDYERERPEFFRLGDDGTYYAVPIGEDDIFRSEVLPGFWLRIEWLWRKPLPRLMDVLKEWGLA